MASGPHSVSWDETKPADADGANTLGTRSRNDRIAVRERMAEDHEWPSTGTEGGYHKKVTLQEQSTNPTLAADEFALYTKEAAGKSNLFFKDEDGNVVQVTEGGKILAATLAAAVADLDLLGNNLALRGEIAAGSTFRELIHIDASDVVVVGDVNEALWLRASGADQLLMDDGVSQYEVWHAGNDGTGSGLDADTVDGVEGADTLNDASGNYVEIELTSLNASRRDSSTHGLGGYPRLVQVFMECTTADDGYAIGDRIPLATGSELAGNVGITVWWNATSCGYAREDDIEVMNKNTGTSDTTIDKNDWKIVFQCWK